ncbi:MAG: DNA polymerase III subunit delta [Clostridia bacterium]|nr:DNA polymerase III subunit delta [Clostridia bacterium]
MKYIEFKNQFQDGQSFPVYIFEGEDAFFRQRGLELIKKRYLSEPELNLTNFDGEPSVSDLIASLNGYPFMSEKRVTVVKEFYPKQNYFKSGLKDYLDAPSNTAILVILNQNKSDAFKKFDKVCVVDCSKADASILSRWVKGECTRNNVTIDSQTARLLSEYCLSDMTRIEKETEKLVSYAGSGGVIDKNVLDQMVVRDVEYQIYNMTEYIAKKKVDLALAVVTDMLSKGEPAQKILVSVYNYFRRLLLVAISDKTVDEYVTLLGIKDFAVRKAKEQAKMFTKRSLKRAVDMLTDFDYKIKSGLIDVSDAMWLSLFKIMIES